MKPVFNKNQNHYYFQAYLEKCSYIGINSFVTLNIYGVDYHSITVETTKSEAKHFFIVGTPPIPITSSLPALYEDRKRWLAEF